MTPGGLERLIAYLLPEMRQKVRELAARRRVSESQIVREAIEAYLEKQTEPPKK